MPDWFFKNGRVRCVRSSPGYEVAFEGLKEVDKRTLRGDGKAYTSTAPRSERAVRIAAHKELKDKGVETGSRHRESQLVQEQRFVKKFKSRIY